MTNPPNKEEELDRFVGASEERHLREGV